MKTIFAFILFCFGSLSSFSQTPESDAIVGVWLTASGKAHVRITKSGNYYYGRIVWLKEPLDKDNNPKVDKNNPDKNKQSNPIMGIRLLSSFEYKGKHTWEDGTIYDPESGKTYQCVITQDHNGTLNIRGFIGFSLIGRTEIWKRIE
jgi:uncharacterized protein (DUF2147 family)